MMTSNDMRDRLVELLQNAPCDYEGNRGVGTIADHLIANGVILPPCKVGDTVYCFDTIVSDKMCKNCNYYYEGGMGDIPCCNKGKCGNRAVECIEIKEILVTEKDLYWWLYMNDFGKTVFLTKEQAEQKLKELRENG